MAVAQHVEACILAATAVPREIDVSRDVLEADQHQRVVVHLMPVAADQGPHMALRFVVVQCLAKAVIDKAGGTANQALAQGADKCPALAGGFRSENHAGHRYPQAGAVRWDRSSQAAASSPPAPSTTPRSCHWPAVRCNSCTGMASSTRCR